MTMKSLEDAFVHELKDLLSAEKQLLQALPKLAKNSSNDQLKEAFETHLNETQEHVHRIEKIFEMLGRAARSEKCDAMKGLIEESKKVLEEEAEADTKDAMIIAAAQKAEHYEIATYGTLCTWAEMLGHAEAAELLGTTLAEEKHADELLTEIAMQGVNTAAAQHGE